MDWPASTPASFQIGASARRIQAATRPSHRAASACPSGQASRPSSARKTSSKVQAEEVNSELLGADERKDQVGQQQDGNEPAQPVQDLDTDHERPPFGPASRASPSTPTISTTQNTARAAIHTMSISKAPRTGESRGPSVRIR